MQTNFNEEDMIKNISGINYLSNRDKNGNHVCYEKNPNHTGNVRIIIKARPEKCDSSKMIHYARHLKTKKNRKVFVK